MAQNKVNLVDFIQESFGSNAKYVEGLLERYQTDPKLEPFQNSRARHFFDLLAISILDLADRRRIPKQPAARAGALEGQRTTTSGVE